MQGLEEVRRLREGEITLSVSNGARVVAVAVETYSLWLPLGFSLLLKDYYYVPVTSKKLISISILAQDNYNFYFNKNMCLIYFENKIITYTFLIDDLYHLYMDASVNINKQIMNAIGSKRLKDRISQKYLWHLRLGHIGEDRLNKLEKDGLLGPLTFESYLICELYL